MGVPNSPIDTALLGFDIKFRQCADAEGVVGRLLLAFDVQAVFGDDLAILRRGHGGVAHVPAEGFEKRVYQRLADMGFLDSGGEERLAVIGEVAAQPGNFIFALIECLALKYG